MGVIHARQLASYAKHKEGGSLTGQSGISVSPPDHGFWLALSLSLSLL